MIALALTAVLGAASALCLAAGMARHQRDLFGRQLSTGRTRAARWAGWLLLLVTAIIAIAHWDWALGVTLWLALVPLAMAASVLLITGSAQRSRMRSTPPV